MAVIEQTDLLLSCSYLSILVEEMDCPHSKRTYTWCRSLYLTLYMSVVLLSYAGIFNLYISTYLPGFIALL